MAARIEVRVGRLLREKGLWLGVAESCTGGLVGYMITSVSGSSEYFKGGIIAYSNELKRTLLGVQAETLRRYGAVSRNTAREMARGARKRLRCDLAIAITGIAGPTGGSPRKPVGCVFISIAYGKDRVKTERFLFSGTRAHIRRSAALEALGMLEDVLKSL